MKKKEKTNFTKATLSGISLIMLVVTIIIMLILATVIVVTISSNNPVSEANKARYESDVDNMQALFTNMVSNIMTKNRGTVKITAGSINKENGEVSYTVRNAKTKKNVEGKIIFGEGTNTDEIFYIGRELPIYGAGDTNWYVDEDARLSLEVAGVTYGNGKVSAAIKVANAPSTYYGEKVTNYTTGNGKIDTEHKVEWQIFYSDGKNIYLIATDYIHYDICPSSTKNKITKSGNDYELSMADVINDYNGSEDISDARLQTLNSSYYEYLSNNNEVSKNENMKAVAYMMDTGIWQSFAGGYADYAIGGPTIEMLVKSYNQKYKADGVDYRAKATSVNGYQISINGGTNWNTAYSSMLNVSDNQYLISASDRKADAMWLASTSSGYISYVMYVGYKGYVGFERYYAYNSHPGFRPIVCLNSDVSLKQVSGGYEIVE